MQLTIAIAQAVGLPDEERATLARLVGVYNEHAAANAIKRRYYEGHVKLGEVNLGLALPKGMAGLEIGCAWGEKTVDVLAARSMFDGFVGRNGEDAGVMNDIMNANRLMSEYMKACRDELKYGCTFATLGADAALGCRIRFHSPENAAAEWDGVKGRIGSGFAIIDMVKDPITKECKPSLIHFHTSTDLWVIGRNGSDTSWTAERQPHPMGRPLMEPLIWNATTKKPFGRSRIKEPIRRMMQSYVRTIANATIGLEFSTSPQKYLLGLTEDQYDAVVSSQFKNYVGSLMAATTNPDTGENPVFGQLQQGTISPHVEMLRMLSSQFAAASGLSVTDVGVVNDANPTSSDAIHAQTESLILMATQLNSGNGDSLHTIALMAQAIARNVTMDELTDEERDVVAHFKNPALPSVASTADAAVKIASSREGFANTDVYLEMVGFDQAEIRRIKAQEARARGMTLLSEFSDNGNTAE